MANRKIMVVDDSSDLQAIAKFGITVIGKDTYVGVFSGRDAVDRAKAERPDIILLDVVMPDQDGPTTLKALQADADTAAIPVIFLTAGGLHRLGRDAASLGAIGTIEKPFDPMELSKQIDALLNA